MGTLFPLLAGLHLPEKAAAHGMHADNAITLGYRPDYAGLK